MRDPGDDFVQEHSVGCFISEKMLYRKSHTHGFVLLNHPFWHSSWWHLPVSKFVMDDFLDSHFQMFRSSVISWTFRHWSLWIRISVQHSLQTNVDRHDLPEHGSSFISTCLDWNAVHCTETCTLVMTCSPHMAISFWWICIGMLPFACRKQVTLLTYICATLQPWCHFGLDVMFPCAHLVHFSLFKQVFIHPQ